MVFFKSKSLSKKQMEHVKNTFDKFDLDSSGGITMDELFDLMHSLGCDVSLEEVKELFEEFDEDGNKEIDFDEFLKLVEKKFLKTWSALDKNKDGLISFEELKKGFKKMGDNYTDEQLLEFMAALDENGDGFISFEEYITGFFSSLAFKNEDDILCK